MGEYLKEAYDNIKKPLRYKWRVFSGSKLLREFERFKDMMKFYKSYRDSMLKIEREGLRWDIHFEGDDDGFNFESYEGCR